MGAAASTDLPASCRSVPITALRELTHQGITESKAGGHLQDAPADAVHDSGKRSKGSATHAMFQAPRQGDTAAVIPEVLGMDYNYKLDARRHRPINNDAPLEDLAKKP